MQERKNFDWLSIKYLRLARFILDKPYIICDHMTARFYK